MNPNQMMGPGGQPQKKPVVLSLRLTPEEASLVLNKLNTAQFTGFTEAQLALAILGKIQSADRDS